MPSVRVPLNRHSGALYRYSRGVLSRNHKALILQDFVI